MDKLIWHYANNGRFTVRSVYNLARRLQQRDMGEGSWLDKKSHWEFIWVSCVPHRVQLFGWKACRNLLPTAENLVPRKVPIGVCCARCREAAEDLYHVFLSCQSSGSFGQCLLAMAPHQKLARVL
ncbi:hypothetical protein Salat_1173200 [Sesamum alatum]|uniref:Reverse transcriptase zinc-binding domain-containing protein n=1 Tax=Sesamum alatum TaxID=300844 RepID=A0AAE2CNI8_9LAMI|nr:hypothetical protein Salat_1173200 [Sesamum alatum]